MDLKERIALWNTGDGKPAKGNLIDWEAYQKEPSINCMCAQGQLLHTVGGWTPEQLKAADQLEADRETARIANISVAHSVLLRNINDLADGAPSVVLTDPAKVLGDQWSKLLDFWWFMDSLDDRGWEEVAVARTAARASARVISNAWDAGGVAEDAAGGAAVNSARGVAAWDAARFASSEIQGAAILQEQGKPFFFLPMFGFATPDDIPPCPADYGNGVVPGGVA